VVRLLAADLVDPAAVLEGLRAMRVDIDDALASINVGRDRWAPTLPHRAHLLEVNHRVRRAAAAPPRRVARRGRGRAQRRTLALVAVAVLKR
jgi:hypothetical protein